MSLSQLLHPRRTRRLAQGARDQAYIFARLQKRVHVTKQA